MSTLVTGGLGFIGSHLVEDLKDPLVVDNRSTCGDQSRMFVEDNTDAEVIHADITDYPKMLDICSTIDEVHHIAAVPRVPASMKDPITTNNANVTGTLTMLKACLENNVKKLVFSSSSSVYGDCQTTMSEMIHPAPASPYAASKWMGEVYCNMFNDLFGMKTSCLRYFNVYGPRQDPNGAYACAIPKFIKLAQTGETIEIYGDGLQTRDFTYVTDVVDANKKAMGKKGTFNVCGGSTVTMNTLTDLILRATRSRSSVKHKPVRKGDIKYVFPSNTLAKDVLNWEPKAVLLEKIVDMSTMF